MTVPESGYIQFKMQQELGIIGLDPEHYKFPLKRETIPEHPNKFFWRQEELTPEIYYAKYI